MTLFNVFSLLGGLALFLFVLVLLVIINVRQSRDEKRREAARREGALS